MTHLRLQGTEEATDAISRIVDELPELDWLKRTLWSAGYTMRQQTWSPLDPKWLLDLSRDNRLRIVQSSSQLLDVIMESLERLDSKLQRESPPLAVYLWNEGKKWQPKDEGRLSDFVAVLLKQDLVDRHVVINREVEIRRGSEPDIIVQATAMGTEGLAEVFTVAIEVKGCWHRQVRSAMEDQLLHKYLMHTAIDQGIYLVGWFNSPKWDSRDYRRGDAPTWSLEQARQQFDDQANTLSTPGNHIAAFVLDAAI